MQSVGIKNSARLEGDWKLAGGVSHRTRHEKTRAPRRGAENRGISAAPAGAHPLGVPIRWLTPPANFRWPSGP